MRRVLILRPEPGATRTAQAAAALGLDPHIHSLFAPQPVDWTAPDPASFDALLVTSAHMANLAGRALAQYHGLPTYAVGEATAQSLRDHGFADLTVGEGDGSAIAARIASDGHARVLHLGGTTTAPIEAGPLAVTHIAVYSMLPADPGPALLRDAVPGAVCLVHSPRAGKSIARILPPPSRTTLHLIAISPAALAASRTGWASAQAPSRPRDDDMLALAVRLCEDDDEKSGKGRDD